MGEFTNPLWLKLLGLLVCLLIAGLNIKLLWDTPQIGPKGVIVGALGIAVFAAWVQWGYKGKPEVAKPEEA
jgi:hypothetical protein